MATEVSGKPAVLKSAKGCRSVSRREREEDEINAVGRQIALAVLLGGGMPAQPAERAEPPRFEAIGMLGGPGAGRFEGPFGIRCAPDGNLYVADDLAHQIVVLAPDGSRIRTLGRRGRRPGELAYPDSLAFSAEGEILVADTGNNRVQAWARDGGFRRMFRRRIGWFGPSLETPRDLVIGPSGRVFVANFGGDSIMVFDASGTALYVIGRRGAAEGELDGPVQLAMDASQRLYVADSRNHRIQVFALGGQFIRAFGRAGSAPGEFRRPHGLAFDASGRLYVADRDNHRIQILDADGAPLGAFGRRGSAPGEFEFPTTLCFDAERRLHVVDSGNHRVQSFRAR
jgi:DNA-binding beta-propeller fold protein YncE